MLIPQGKEGSAASLEAWEAALSASEAELRMREAALDKRDAGLGGSVRTGVKTVLLDAPGKAIGDASALASSKLGGASAVASAKFGDASARLGGAREAVVTGPADLVGSARAAAGDVTTKHEEFQP